MNFSDLEEAFNRSVRYSFSRKKLFFLWAVLVVCGFLTVFCRVVSIDSNSWISMSMSFLPFFLCTGVLLAAGVLLMKMYSYELSGDSYSFKKILTKSMQLVMEVAYIALPLVLFYLVLWMVMGVFHLMRLMPGVGDFACVVLSFGPFVLTFMALSLCVLSVSMLFFVTPHVASRGSLHPRFVNDVLKRISSSFFVNMVHFIVGLLPPIFICTLLMKAVSIVETSYLPLGGHVVASLQWFFIMVPFTFILTPFVAFFFNFSMESFRLFGGVSNVKRENARKAHEEECVVR